MFKSGLAEWMIRINFRISAIEKCFIETSIVVACPSRTEAITFLRIGRFICMSVFISETSVPTDEMSRIEMDTLRFPNARCVIVLSRSKIRYHIPIKTYAA